MKASSSIEPSVANVANVLATLAGLVSEREAQDQHDSRRHALALINKYPGCSIEQLRGPLGLSHSGCVRLVGRLVDLGLLEKRASAEDARGLELYLTDDGRQVAERDFSVRRLGVGELLECFSSEEQSAFFQLIQKLLRENVQGDEAIGRVCRGCCYDDCQVCPFRQSLEGES